MTREDELLERARELAARAESWADLSNDLLAPGTGLLAVTFPDPADRRAFRHTPQHREIMRIMEDAIGRFGVVAGATPVASPPPVAIVYRNHRGVTGVRRVLPRALRYGSSEWHPEPQWLLDALDVDKGAERTFALKDVLEWGV